MLEQKRATVVELFSVVCADHALRTKTRKMLIENSDKYFFFFSNITIKYLYRVLYSATLLGTLLATHVLYALYMLRRAHSL